MRFRYILLCFGMSIALGVWGDKALAAPFSAAGIVLLALNDRPRKGEWEV